MLNRQGVVLALTFALCSSVALQAGTLVVPGSDTATEGNTNNCFPFGISCVGSTSQRYQQVYASSEFGGRTILITGIDFRPDADTGRAFSTTLSSMSVDLSTTSAAVDALSLTFADNVGADNTSVFGTGPLSISSAFAGPLAGPKAFDIHIEFTTSFLYNPANGNLLLDVRNFGGGFTTQFDADSNGGATSRVYNLFDVGSATASGRDSLGLVTQFDVGAGVPEPSTGLLISGALVGLFLIGRARSQSA
jgi:hypothetical protein